MSLTNYPNGITSFGVPVIPGASGTGLIAFRKVYFVDGTNGSTGNTGLSVSAAFNTVQAALDVVKDEDSIIVLRGSYDEALTTGQLTDTDNMTEGRGRYVNLIGASTGKWAYDSPQLYNVSGSTATLRMRSPGWRVSGFRIVGDSGSPICVTLEFDQAGATNDTNWAPGTTLDNNVFYGAVGSTDGIDFQGAPPDIRVLDNIFELFSGTNKCITSSVSGTAQANRCTIAGNQFIDNVNSIDMNPRGFNATHILNNYIHNGHINTLIVGIDNTGGNDCLVAGNYLGGDTADSYGDAHYIAATGDHWIGNATSDSGATNTTGAWTHGDPAT